MKENTTFKNELTSNQILDFASMLQLVLGCSIIMLNLFSTLILIRSTKMMFSVRLPAINMSISYILLGIGLLVPDTLVFDRHVCLSKNYTVQALLFVSSLIITMMNADRVFSLRFPFKYSSLMSRKNVRIGCLMCWLIGFFSCIHENTCGWTNLVTQRSLTYNFGFFFCHHCFQYSRILLCHSLCHFGYEGKNQHEMYQKGIALYWLFCSVCFSVHYQPVCAHNVTETQPFVD